MIRKALTMGLMAMLLAGCYPTLVPRTAVQEPVAEAPRTPEQRALSWAITLCSKFGYARKTEEFRLCAEARYDQFLMENK